MKKPLKEHYEMDTDYGTTLAVFNYVEDLEKYVEELEQALSLGGVVGQSEQLCQCEDVDEISVDENWCRHCEKHLR